MALTKTVTKKSVTNPQSKLYIITFNLKVSDGVSNVIDQDFSCEYRTGEVVTAKVAEITEKMQICVDRYKAEQVIFNSAGLDNAVSNISGGLIL